MNDVKEEELFIDDFEDPSDEEEVSEEAPAPMRRSQSPRRGKAHIPGHRRKPNFVWGERVAPSEETTEDEEIDGVAPATESVSEADVVSDQGHEVPQPGGHEKPMTFGSVDG